MASELILTALFILGAILLVHPRTLAFLRGVDARNRARIENERSDRSDRTAHFRHTLGVAEEQVEAVSAITVPDERTGVPVRRWVFEGETFASEDDAEAVRAEKMRAIALGFYRELPAALHAPKEDDRIRRN